VLARDEGRDQVHRARAVQRVQGDQVLQPAGLGVAQHALHAAGFELEHRLGQAVGEQLVDRLVVQRDLLEGEVLLVGVAGGDELLGQLQDGQRGQAQEVELHQADLLDVVLVELADRRVAAGLLVERAEVGDLARRDQHAPGVHADVAHHALDTLGQAEQGRHLFLGRLALLQLGRLQAGVDQLGIGLLRHLGQRHMLARRRRDQLGDGIHMAEAHAQHPAHVAQRGLGGHGAEGGDLAHGLAAVALLHVLDHAVAVALAEVHVEVGHGHPLRVQEALEQQVVLQRVQVGDGQHIGHQRARTGAPARAHRAAVGLGPLDEVRHDEEVAREPHLQDGVELELQPLDIGGPLGLALGRVGEQQLQPLLQAFVGLLAQEVADGHGAAIGQRRGREVRQEVLAQHQGEVAARGNAHAVGQRRGMSANSAAISAWDLKYWSGQKRLTRRGLARVSPSATQTRASWASKSSAVRNCTGWVATTGSCSSAASGTEARTRASWCGRPPRCSSM
jgi:hypothetical protein